MQLIDQFSDLVNSGVRLGSLLRSPVDLDCRSRPPLLRHLPDQGIETICASQIRCGTHFLFGTGWTGQVLKHSRGDSMRANSRIFI